MCIDIKFGGLCPFSHGREYQDDDIGLWAMRLLTNITCDNHNHTIIHVLYDLGYSIYARGFGDGFHEGIVPSIDHLILAD